MRSTTSNTHVSLAIFAISVLITRGEHLRTDLHAGSGVGEEENLHSISTKLKHGGGQTEDRPTLINLAKPTVSGRKLLTSREVLTSSLVEPHSDEYNSLREFKKGERPIRIYHMHIPKTAGSSFDIDVKRMGFRLPNTTSMNRSAWELTNVTRNIDALKSNMHDFTSDNTREPMNVSRVSNQSGSIVTIDDRDGRFAVATDLYMSNQSQNNVTVDDLDEQYEVTTDLFAALEKGDGLNSTRVEIAPVFQALSVSRGEKMKIISRECCLEEMLRDDISKDTRSNANQEGQSAIRDQFGINLQKEAFLVTLLREPVAHVQSMYLKCKYAHKEGPGLLRAETHRVLGEDITDWVDHYIRNPIDKLEKRLTNHHTTCYNPSNMQTRAFSCRRDLWYDISDTNHTFELAKERMKLFDFVGITERFRESLCVFSAVVRSRAPSWCNCSDTAAWASYTGAHNRMGKYPDHQVSDLNETQRAAIQKLTTEDDKLYKFATQRFDAQIADYEAKGILKLSC